MRVFAFWYGGPSYALLEKPEEFSSIKKAGEELESRYENAGYPATPAVSKEQCEMLLHEPMIQYTQGSSLKLHTYASEPFARLFLNKNGRWQKENL